jgi:hypothetical protein
MKQSVSRMLYAPKWEQEEKKGEIDVRGFVNTTSVQLYYLYTSLNMFRVVLSSSGCLHKLSLNSYTSKCLQSLNLYQRKAAP